MDVRFSKTTAMSNIIEYFFRRFLLLNEMSVMELNFDPLTLNRVVKIGDTFKGIDLRFNDGSLDGFGDKIIAAAINTLGQIVGVG